MKLTDFTMDDLASATNLSLSVLDCMVDRLCERNKIMNMGDHYLFNP